MFTRAFRKYSLCSATISLIVMLPVYTVAPTAARADSQVRIVRLSDVQGSVQIDKNNGLGFENAFLNLPVTQGTQIRTRDLGRAEIEFEDGSTLRLAPDSKVEFSTLGLNDSGNRISVIHLVEGSAYVNWFGKVGDQFTLNFSREKASLDHAAHFRVETSPELAKFAVFKGDVQISGPAGDVTVPKKKMVAFNAADGDKTTALKNIDGDALDSWDKNATEYHDQYAKNAASVASPYGYGLSDLGYYGAFTNVSGYGMMWQPYFTGMGWDPFMDGAWSYYPGTGYMFASAYPWGWLPYRYGTWMFIPSNGWMWQPGNWNGWTAVPRYVSAGAVGFRAPVVPAGALKTVVVGHGGAVAPVNLASRTVISRDSASLGVPRGSLLEMKSLNREVAKTGMAEVRPAPQFNAVAQSHVGPFSMAPAEGGSGAREAHAGSISSAGAGAGHAGGGSAVAAGGAAHH